MERGKHVVTDARGKYFITFSLPGVYKTLWTNMDVLLIALVHAIGLKSNIKRHNSKHEDIVKK